MELLQGRGKHSYFDDLLELLTGGVSGRGILDALERAGEGRTRNTAGIDIDDLIRGLGTVGDIDLRAALKGFGNPYYGRMKQAGKRVQSLQEWYNELPNLKRDPSKNWLVEWSGGREKQATDQIHKWMKGKTKTKTETEDKERNGSFGGMSQQRFTKTTGNNLRGPRYPGFNRKQVNTIKQILNQQNSHGGPTHEVHIISAGVLTSDIAKMQIDDIGDVTIATRQAELDAYVESISTNALIQTQATANYADYTDYKIKYKVDKFMSIKNNSAHKVHLTTWDCFAKDDTVSYPNQDFDRGVEDAYGQAGSTTQFDAITLYPTDSDRLMDNWNLRDKMTYHIAPGDELHIKYFDDWRIWDPTAVKRKVTDSSIVQLKGDHQFLFRSIGDVGHDATTKTTCSIIDTQLDFVLKKIIYYKQPFNNLMKRVRYQGTLDPLTNGAVTYGDGHVATSGLGT